MSTYLLLKSMLAAKSAEEPASAGHLARGRGLTARLTARGLQ
jgi:hypothetical protein